VKFHAVIETLAGEKNEIVYGYRGIFR